MFPRFPRFAKPPHSRGFLAFLLASCLAVHPAASSPKDYYVRDIGILPGQAPRPDFPTGEDLAKSRAVLLAGGKPWSGADKARLDAFVENGGGVVLVHDAITASGWIPGTAKKWSGQVPLFFTPSGRTHPITRGVSNFDLQDEMIHGLEIAAGSAPLATTWTPDRKHLKGTDPQPYVYGVSPMIWTEERGKGRVVYFVPGSNEASFGHPAIRTLLRRSLAWAARSGNVDEMNSAADLAALTYPPGGPLSPEASLATLQVHPEFAAELVAAEPLISKPLNIDWDAKGHLWVIESVEYPEGRQAGGPESMPELWQRDTPLPKPPPVARKGHDKISWLEDSDGDGMMDRKHVFADDLDLATSFCFYRDGVIVSQAPDVLYLRDTDGDGRADHREVLYTGLGTFDRHAVLNNLRWGLDGWIYATHGYSGSPSVTSADGGRDFGAIGSGVVRMKPDGSAIEMYSAKSGNCWGIDMTSEGEIFFTQPTSGDLVMHVPVSDRLMAEGGLGKDPSWQVMVHLRPVKPLMTWEEIVENQPNDVIGSFTAACGCAVYEGGSWPGDWTLGYFTAEPTVHIVHHEAVSADGATFAARKTREEEFSATRDFWSRPIDTRVGPDGQLYVIDFYNQAILHNDPRGPIHLWNNQAARPDRDHFFGRIHRYRHRQSKPLPEADLATLHGRIAALEHPNREIRLRAQRLIEEDDIKAAARLLEAPAGPAKLHALWIRSAAGMLSTAEIISALEDPDPAVRITVARVLKTHTDLAGDAIVSAIAGGLPAEKDARVRLQWLACLPSSAVLPADLLVSLQAHADDRWTQAAIARLARNSPAGVLAAALSARSPEKQAPLAALLFQACREDAGKLAAMLEALDAPGQKSREIAVASLMSLRQHPLPRGVALETALTRLAGNSDPQLSAAALSLAAGSWTPEQIGERVPGIVSKLLRSAPRDARVLEALATLPAFPPALLEVLRDEIIRPGELRTPLISALVGNLSPDAAKLMISLLPSLPAAEKSRVVEALLGRSRSAMALTDALQSGELPLAVVGSQVLARLSDHPDASVKDHAAPMVARLRGAVEAKDAIIARLLPEASTPGNAEAGKALFATCAVCHSFRGEGITIGPVLEGIGAHGIEALLTHIVDPNREVEPSYHVWNVTTSEGRGISGFISRETKESLFLRNAAGEVEVPRALIVSQVDTGKSLMPEGFEGMGAPALRDLIAYLRSGEQRYHLLPLGKAATADGSRGVYLSTTTAGDSVGIRRYGQVTEHGVPFHLQDPASAPDGKSVIVLKGGLDPAALSHSMPREVEIPVRLAAGRLHLLGAVAGWGFPVVQEPAKLLEITVHYADRTTELLEFRNGIDISDHVAGAEVPGSVRTDLTTHGQIRYLWRDLKNPAAVIEKLVISSTDSQPAPMIAAITLESADKAGTMAAPPAEGGAVAAAELPRHPAPDRLRVLLAGGGSSHDFSRWFDREDQAVLREAGRMVSTYTGDPEEAARLLGRADVLLFSANDAAYARSDDFREALGRFTARGGGLVLLHPATWYNWPEWPEYNRHFAGGGARAHDPLGEFRLKVLNSGHPVTAGLPPEFEIRDEHYQVMLDPPARAETLLETSVSAQTGKKHPAVWIVPHPKSRIVGIAPGHDESTHRNKHFRRLLANAVRWAGKQ